jgi:hypothetical protein
MEAGMGRAVWRPIVPSYKVFVVGRGKDAVFAVARRGRVLDEGIVQLEFARPVKVTFIRRDTPKRFLIRRGEFAYEVHAWCDVKVRGGEWPEKKKAR